MDDDDGDDRARRAEGRGREEEESEEEDRGDGGREAIAIGQVVPRQAARRGSRGRRRLRRGRGRGRGRAQHGLARPSREPAQERGDAQERARPRRSRAESRRRRSGTRMRLPTTTTTTARGTVWRGHRLSVTGLALTADDTTAYSVSKEGGIVRWDVETGARTKFPRAAGSGGPDEGRRRPDGAAAMRRAALLTILRGGAGAPPAVHRRRGQAHPRLGHAEHGARAGAGVAPRRATSPPPPRWHRPALLGVGGPHAQGVEPGRHGVRGHAVRAPVGGDVRGAAAARARRHRGQGPHELFWKVAEDSQLASFAASPGAGQAVCARVCHAGHLGRGQRRRHGRPVEHHQETRGDVVGGCARLRRGAAVPKRETEGLLTLRAVKSRQSFSSRSKPPTPDTAQRVAAPGVCGVSASSANAPAGVSNAGRALNGVAVGKGDGPVRVGRGRRRDSPVARERGAGQAAGAPACLPARGRRQRAARRRAGGSCWPGWARSQEEAAGGPGTRTPLNGLLMHRLKLSSG